MYQLPMKSRLFNKLYPETQWGWDEILANNTNYLLEMLLWAKTEDATKKVPQHRPEPFVPDFMPKKKKEKESVAMDIDDIEAYLTRPRT